jgi:hypothetical protein
MVLKCCKCKKMFLQRDAKYVLLDYRSPALLTCLQTTDFVRILCPQCRELLEEWLGDNDDNG